MTRYEAVERLCAVNAMLLDIVRELSSIIEQHGIEVGDGPLSDKIARAAELCDAFADEPRQVKTIQ